MTWCTSTTGTIVRSVDANSPDEAEEIAESQLAEGETDGWDFGSDVEVSRVEEMVLRPHDRAEDLID